MLRLGGVILDVYDDPHLAGLPEELRKEAEAAELSYTKVAKVPDTHFALIVTDMGGQTFRKFPVHDVLHAKLAAHCFLANGHRLPLGAQDVTRHFIERALCRSTNTKFASELRMSNRYVVTDKDTLDPVEMPKTASVKDGLSLSQPFLTASDWSPALETVEEIKRAVEVYREMAGNMLPEPRVKVGSAIQQAADAKGIPHNIPLYDFDGPVSLVRLKLAASARTHNGLDADSAKVLREMQSHRLTKGAAARLLETMDLETGFQQHWLRRDFPDPWTTLCVKEAEVSETGLTEDQIRKIAGLKEAERLLGADGCKAMQAEPAAVFDSLPKPTRSTLLNMV